jgi:two-component system, LytTR family, response regulator LytT
MKLFIVEDEPVALRHLQNMLHKITPTVEVAGTAGSIRQAVKWLQQNPAPDLALMDIELTDGQSFEIFEEVQVPCPVIFITAYESFALQAFSVNSIDYLLKPVDDEDLHKSLHKFRTMQHLFSKGQEQASQVQQLVADLKMQLQQQDYKDRFLVKTGQRYRTIEISDITFFEAEDKTVFLHCSDGQKYIVNHSLDELEYLLHPKQFFRANRQFIIALKSVQSMHAGYNGKLNVLLGTAPKQEVVVSRERAGALKEWLGG